MTIFLVHSVLAWLLSAFFAFGALMNFKPPAKILKDYRRWGYPKHFHYVTAVLEAATALLLFFPETRPAGGALGALIMGAAVSTVVRHREYAHVPAPAAAGIACLVVGTWAMSWVG